MIYRINYRTQIVPGCSPTKTNSILIEAVSLTHLEQQFEIYKDKNYGRSYRNNLGDEIKLISDGIIESIIVEGNLEKIMSDKCQHVNIVKIKEGQEFYCKDCKSYVTGREFESLKIFTPIEGQNYYCADVFYPSMCNICTYQDNSNFHFRMKYNLLFKTKEEAVARSKELLGIIE